EFAGSEQFVDGVGAPLLRPTLRVNGEVRELAAEGIAWERAVQWLPTFTCTSGSLVGRGSIFAPHGRDTDLSRPVYTMSVENRGPDTATIDIALDGTLGHRQMRVRSARPFADAHRASVSADDVVVLEGTALPGIVAFALGADGDAIVDATNGDAPT